MFTTVREFTYGWDLTCAKCGGVIPEGTEADITEDEHEQYVKAEHIDCTTTEQGA